MDFFEHQEQARRNTSLLVFYYVLAVVLIILAVYAAFSIIFIGMHAKGGRQVDLARLWNPDLFLWVVGITLAVVVSGTLFKIAQLAGGGKAVADMLGGRPINRNTTDPDERKALNVVEEMAVASGIPVPPVFLLEGESGINAFAAGFNPGDAVIGVTRGCLRELSRDQLQGVVAHEFSHILNGDMRLNIRLMGVLNGILVIALIGYGILRTGAGTRVRSRSRDNRGGAAILILGILLMIIGYVGVFFGKLIKSAVSRQREFLADASAVQFTRNPAGIAGALNRIAGYSAGSRLHTSKAQETSHFFFSNGVAKSLVGLMATHPPLKERIRRIDSSFLDGSVGGARTSAMTAGAKSSPTGVPAAVVSGFAADADEVVARIGAPRTEHLAYASKLIGDLPEMMAEAAREPFGARAVVYSLLLDREEGARGIQVKRLSEHADPAVYDETIKLASTALSIRAELRLPLVDLAVSSLKELSEAQYQAFKTNVTALVGADSRIDLFEYVIQRMILRYLEQVFHGARPPSVKYHSVDSVGPACGRLLSCLAHWGTGNTDSARSAFAGAVARLKAGEMSMNAIDSCGLDTVDRALDVLNRASAPVKRRIVEACTVCVGADGRVTVEEAELLRAIADSLDCPIPPFLPDASST